jgi:LCP family protein required for cell wall assembly
MRRAWRCVRVALRLLPVVLLLVVVVPGSAVRPTTISLVEVETARGYDAGSDVVWVLVLGLDGEAPPKTDAIQLLGIDSRSGAAAAIGIPRDSYVDLHGSLGMGRINLAYAEGGAELAARVVSELVTITPDYVLATQGDGFVAMVDALGGVTVDSPLAFTTDEGDVRVTKGPNQLDSREALLFAQTRLFGDQPGPGDFIRSANHQALLLGLLRQLQSEDDSEGFVEDIAQIALDGIDGADASPLDLYKLLNLLTGVDPAKTEGCVVTGAEQRLPNGDQVIVPDDDLARRLGQETADDATFETTCEPVVP